MGFLYVIGPEDENEMPRVKIGYSMEPSARLKSLQTGAPVKLAMKAVFAATANVEKEIHRELADFRSHLEWFDCSSEFAAQFIQEYLRDKDYKENGETVLIKGPDEVIDWNNLCTFCDYQSIPEVVADFRNAMNLRRADLLKYQNLVAPTLRRSINSCLGKMTAFFALSSSVETFRQNRKTIKMLLTDMARCLQPVTRHVEEDISYEIQETVNLFLTMRWMLTNTATEEVPSLTNP